MRRLIVHTIFDSLSRRLDKTVKKKFVIVRELARFCETRSGPVFIKTFYVAIKLLNSNVVDVAANRCLVSWARLMKRNYSS